MTTIVVHKTFTEEGEANYFVATQTGVTEMNDAKLQKLLSKCTASDTTIRITNVSSAFKLVQSLRTQGFRVVSAHWHATGIEKNLEPTEIAQQFYNLSDEPFTEVKLRADIFELRQMIAARYAVLDFRRAAQLKLSAVSRTMGLSDADALPSYLEAARLHLLEEKKEIEDPIQKAINKAAEKIPECILLNKILGITGKSSWMTSASVVAYVGDVERFPMVSSLWAYAGQSVVNGKAPKRAKGQTQTWNPKLKTALWSWMDSALKTKNPIHRPAYDTYRAAELLVHEQKCEKCSALKCGTEAQAEKKRLVIQSHSGARARRRVVKDVLKQFWLEARGEETKEIATGATA